MHIRKATRHDTVPIRRLIHSVLEEYGLSPDPSGVDADIEDISGYYGIEGASFEVLEDDDGAVLGTVALYPVRSDACELRKMYLHRSLRGQGWGKAVMQRMIRRAKDHGFHVMTCETASVLTEAIGLYEDFGFRQSHAFSSIPRCNRAYRLELSSATLPREPIPELIEKN